MKTVNAGGSGAYQQLDASYITAMALSPMGDYLAFGDVEGQLHLWTTHDTSDISSAKPPFNGYDGIKPEWPDQVDPPSLSFDENTPFNIIGMPYYSEPLLSNIPLSDYAPVTSPFFNLVEPIPPQILSTMKVTDMIGYAAMPRELKGRRYARNARVGAGKYATGKGWTISRRESGPHFRSDKERQKQAAAGEVEEEVCLHYDIANIRLLQVIYRNIVVKSKSNIRNLGLKILTLGESISEFA
jgi:PAB-dependent poly(A)-specific ribonuclease subunit 2